MSRIRGSDTKPELEVRKRLFARGWRYRVNWPAPGGRVDIAFPALRVAILLDGCFWHSCPQHGVKPKTNTQFWSAKLAANRARDQKQSAALDSAGWRVLRFWEHQVRDDADSVAATVHHLLLSARRDLVGRKRARRM